MNLSDNEAKALSAWNGLSEDFSGLNFATIHAKSGLDHTRVRRTVRALARKGLVHFSQTLWSDDGAMMGAGYSLTPLGFAELCDRHQS